MRLLHVDANTAWTGREAMIRDLVVAGEGSHAAVLPPDSALAPVLRDLGVVVAEVPFGGLLVGARPLASVVDGVEADLIVAHGEEAAGRLARVGSDTPLAVVVREGPRDPRKWLDRAAGVVLADGALRASWLGAGVKPDRLHVVPEGVDTEALAPDPEGAAALRERWGVADDVLLVGVVAATAAADPEGLIDALARLARRRRDVAGVLVGAAAESRRLAARARRAGAPLHVVGSLPAGALPAILGAIEVLVEPRDGQRVTRIVLEGAAAGVPLVTVLPEDALPDGLALRVAPDDGRALADAIEEVLRQRSEARHRTWAAREWVVAERGLPTMIAAATRTWAALAAR